MRRALRLVQQAGALQALQAPSTGAAQAAAALPQLVRHMGGPAGSHPETPLSKIMPSVVTIPRQILSTAASLTGKLIVSAATSGPAKSVVSAVGDKVVVDEVLVKIEDLDPSYWAYWLGTTGYSSQAGFKKLAEAAKAKVAGFSTQQITNLVVGLNAAKYFDKELVDGVAKNISANFTKFETEQLLQILPALAENGYYSAELYDDIADSITYCNHYLAAVKVPTSQVAQALAAYAKFSHERADLLLALSRGISEVGLSALSADERKEAVVASLKALSAFNFYPEQVDALLYYAKTESAAYSADELKAVEAVQSAVEAQTGGSLQLYEPSEEDATHWYGHHQHAPSTYDLYVFREALIPKSYSPAAFRPRK